MSGLLPHFYVLFIYFFLLLWTFPSPLTNLQEFWLAFRQGSVKQSIHNLGMECFFVFCCFQWNIWNLIPSPRQSGSVLLFTETLISPRPDPGYKAALAASLWTRSAAPQVIPDLPPSALWTRQPAAWWGSSHVLLLIDFLPKNQKQTSAFCFW